MKLHYLIEADTYYMVSEVNLCMHKLRCVGTDPNILKERVKLFWANQEHKLSVVTVDNTSLTIYSYTEWANRT